MKKVAKDLFRGREEEDIVDRLMDKGLAESEAFRVIDDAQRALRDDRELVADLEWDSEITDVARDLYDGMAEDKLVIELIAAGWREADALELIELAEERLEKNSALRRRFDRELDKEDDRSDEDGVPASNSMIVWGWILVVLAGLLGLIIPLILTTSKDRSTKSGFKYDEESRNTGKRMFRLAIILIGVSLLFTFIRMVTIVAAAVHTS